MLIVSPSFLIAILLKSKIVKSIKVGFLNLHAEGSRFLASKRRYQSAPQGDRSTTRIPLPMVWERRSY